MEIKIESYIRSMQCSPEVDGYECIGKWALYNKVARGSITHEKNQTYEKALKKVVSRLRKEGYEIGLGGGFIHMNGKPKRN